MLQHHDPPYRVAREPSLNLVVHYPFKLVQLRAFHGAPSRVTLVNVTRSLPVPPVSDA